MAHNSIKLIPGVNVTETPALNQAGVASSQLIRYVYDPQHGALIQKLGGWQKFYSNPTTSIARALWAWEDTNSVSHLAYGTQTNQSTGQAKVGVITNGVDMDVTPRITADSITLVVSTTSGSSIVTVTDTTTTNLTVYDSVYIPTHIAVGGLVLFGLYPVDPNGFLSTTQFTVQAVNILGVPLSATFTSTSPVLAQLTTTATQASTTVVLPNHGYSVGSTFPILIATTVGGATFLGNYLVQTVVDLNTFTITAPTLPTSSTSVYVNGGKAYFIYGFGIGAIPAATGYGIGGYGSGGYGVGAAIIPSTGTPIDANDWTMDNWGENLITVPIRSEVGPQYQPIYQYSPTGATGPTAVVVPNCPPVNDGAIVAMPQRQIVAWGSTFTGIQDPLLVRWCDVNNYSTWVGTVTNQAGSYRIPKGSKIVGILQTPQQGLLWTDVDVWSMQYIGQPYVYSFNEIGSGCGLIGRKAMGTLGGSVYWMAPSQFYVLGASGVEPVPCPVWDVVFQNMDMTNTSKIRCAVNSRFGEITWYYPTTTSGGEVSAYVKYNAYLNVWDFGTLGRTAWVDQSVLGPPIGSDPVTNYIYQHETAADADGQPMLSNFTTGYAALSEGEDKMYVDQLWPDMKFGNYGGAQTATVNLTFYVADFPGQTPKTFGPYTFSQNSTYFTPRFRGRLVSVQINSADTGSFWRIGNIRYRVSPDGKF